MGALELSADFEIINLGNSNPVALATLIRLLEDAIGRKAEVRHLPDQPGDVPTTCADISKARRLLDYHPLFPIEKGIEAFVRWLRTDGQGADTP
jgi:UDP-glucuronate 4-epimerase